MEANQVLKTRMDDAGFTQAELAEAVNADLRAAGFDGTVSDRTVRNWLTGKTRWPHHRQRDALAAVFSRPVTELGFVPRGSSSRLAAPEVSVLRRRFITASTGAALGAVAGPSVGTATPRRVGASDVQRLLSKFATLVASDHQHGGRLTTEAQANALAGEALALQTIGSASQRVRSALYGCAASFTSSAMWAAIDGHRFDAAQRHFDRAGALAAMSGDLTIQFRIWSHAGSLYRHLARPADALAANDVARQLPITRRDPMFAALGHARHAAIHGLARDSKAARQAIGHAQDAFERADPNEQRPLWMAAVCGRGELEELALSAHIRLGNYEEAESHAHRSLALLSPYMQRDRAIVSARLAHAQLGQGDLEPALATAMSVADGQHPRVSGMLQDFGRALHAAAPGSHLARRWEQCMQDSTRTRR